MNFSYTRRVHFYETDLMGIVHHSNYIRIFEETRVAWLNSKTGFDRKYLGDKTLAVLEAHTHFKQAPRFNDLFSVQLQVRNQGVRFYFRYAMYSGDNLIATGETVHALLNNELKVCKPPKEFLKILENEIWTETWP